MAKIIATSVNKIEYGQIEYEGVSGVKSFKITNTSTQIEAVVVSTIVFPEYVQGKLSDSPIYADYIIGNFIIPFDFVSGQKYYMKTDGRMLIDETNTGILLGAGQTDKTLLVDILICLQDEEGFILEDEEGNFLEDV